MAARTNSVDPRAERVRAKLRDAAFVLAHERSVDQLTVGNIVEKAEVSRQVFYQHFRDRDDAVAYAIGVAFASATADIDGDPRSRIVALFDFAAEHRAMYRNVVPSAVTLRVPRPATVGGNEQRAQTGEAVGGDDAQRDQLGERLLDLRAELPGTIDELVEERRAVLADVVGQRSRARPAGLPPAPPTDARCRTYAAPVA